jgi:hypothetical protein
MMRAVRIADCSLRLILLRICFAAALAWMLILVKFEEQHELTRNHELLAQSMSHRSPKFKGDERWGCDEFDKALRSGALRRIDGGGSKDIYSGSWQGRPIVLKRLRMLSWSFVLSPYEVYSSFLKEALYLSHHGPSIFDEQLSEAGQLIGFVGACVEPFKMVLATERCRADLRHFSEMSGFGSRNPLKLRKPTVDWAGRLSLGVGLAGALDGMHPVVPQDHLLCDFHLAQFMLCDKPLKKRSDPEALIGSLDGAGFLEYRGGGAVGEYIVKLVDMDSIQRSGVPSGARCSSDNDCHFCSPLFVNSIRNEYRRYGLHGLLPRELTCVDGVCEAMGAAFDVFRAGDFLRQLLLPCPKRVQIPESASDAAYKALATCNAIKPVIQRMLDPSPTARPKMSVALHQMEQAQKRVDLSDNIRAI